MDTKVKILIAEEETEFNREGCNIFEKYGMEQRFCEKDGIRLLEEIESFSPDVVLMNMFMSNIDGLGVMKAVKAKTNGSKPTFVVISNFDSSMLERESLNAGAAYYVIKPFRADDLIERISGFVKCCVGRPMGEIVSIDRDMEIRVTEILHQIGVPAHIKGYHYLRDSIIMSVNQPDIINAVTKQLYPSVAKKYETTSSRVERAIRHAIEVAWDRGDVDVLNSYFGYTIHNSRGKPTNSEFIAMISDRLRLHMKNAS